MTVFWALYNSHEVFEANDRNVLKVMVLVAIVDGKVPIFHAFIDENRRRGSNWTDAATWSY